MPLRQFSDRSLERVGSDRGIERCRLGHGRKAFRRGRGEPFPLRGECGHHLAHEPQRQIGSTGGHQSRVFPDDKVLIVAIPCVAGAEANRDRILPLGHRKLHAEFLPIGQRCHRFHPGRRSVRPAKLPRDLSRMVELPEGVLPAGDTRDECSSIIRGRGFPTGPQRVEDQGRLTCRRRFTAG